MNVVKMDVLGVTTGAAHQDETPFVVWIISKREMVNQRVAFPNDRDQLIGGQLDIQSGPAKVINSVGRVRGAAIIGPGTGLLCVEVRAYRCSAVRVGRIVTIAVSVGCHIT